MKSLRKNAQADLSARVFLRSLATLSVTSMLLVLGFVSAGAASAATQTVTITSLGYVPNTSSIAVGDSISFVNGDLAVHEVSFNKKSGVTCSATPLVLQPAASGKCTFQNPGTYSYSDPLNKGKTYSGTVVVSKTSPSVSLAITPGAAIYGHSETLSGTISDQRTGESVQILAQSCGQTAATAIGTATTTTGGYFVFHGKPLNKTIYSAKSKNATSNSVLAQVRPRQSLRRISPNRYSLRVYAAASFAKKYVTLQRFNSSLRRWVNVRNVTLRANSSGVAPTVVSTAVFSAALAGRQRVRTVLPQVSAGNCYLFAISNAVYNK